MNDVLIAPRASLGPSPARRPGSVRRTSTVEVSWPEGRTGRMRLYGHARDLVTPRAGGAAFVAAEDRVEAFLDKERAIDAITTDPPRADIGQLVGHRSGGGMRRKIGELLPDEQVGGTPLYLLLDDLPAMNLISPWAWSQWDPDWRQNVTAHYSNEQLGKLLAQREGVCIGHARGATGQDPERSVSKDPEPDAATLRRADDPLGWHDHVQTPGVAMHRARRIDVWVEDGQIRLDAEFQDSGGRPDGTRAALHEYGVTATADLETMRLTSVAAQPRVLPYGECPGAIANVHRLVGTPLDALREKVLAELPRTAGCTHLNDALRSLAEAPILLKKLG